MCALDENIQYLTHHIPNGYRFSLLPALQTPRKAMVVFHGNGGCAMQSILSFVRVLYVDKNENSISPHVNENQCPTDIIVYEYAGFGHRFGQKLKKQKEFLAEACLFTKYILSLRCQNKTVHDQPNQPDYLYNDIILVGTSLGTGVATHVLYQLTHGRQQGGDEKSTNRIRKLVLITPYSSMKDTVNHQTGGLLGWMSSWKLLDNVKNLNALQRTRKGEDIQKIIVFGEDDRLLSVDKHAHKLTPYANKTYVLTKTDHNSWFNTCFIQFWKRILLLE